jgi:hypothetical protein
MKIEDGVRSFIDRRAQHYASLRGNDLSRKAAG